MFSMARKLVSLLILSCMLFAGMANSAGLVLATASASPHPVTKTVTAHSCHDNIVSDSQHPPSANVPVHGNDTPAKLLHECCSGVALFLLSSRFSWPDQEVGHARAPEPILILTLHPENPFRPPIFLLT